MKGVITGEVIILVIAALQPVLVKSVTAAVTTAVATASKQIMLDLRKNGRDKGAGCEASDGSTQIKFSRKCFIQTTSRCFPPPNTS